MSRPLTRNQTLQNRAFLRLLQRTGNVRLACRELGLKYGSMQYRRRVHRAFAARWDAALVVAEARLAGKLDGARRIAPSPRSRSARVDQRLEADGPPNGPSQPLPEGERGFRTGGGEVVIVRLKNGTCQIRRAQPGKLTRAAEQAFLAALAATCNVALSAAAVGAAEAAFHRRKRKDPGFAREMRMAIEEGYLQLETALLQGFRADSHEHDDWRKNERPAMPPMTPNQALQLLYLHQKEARLLAEPPHIRRRPRESDAAHSVRLSAMYEERQRLAREAFEVAEAGRAERGEPPWGPAGAEVRARLGLMQGLGLPDLAQVTGWSHADPAKAPHDPRRALFGGWRIEEMEAALAQPSPGP